MRLLLLLTALATASASRAQDPVLRAYTGTFALTNARIETVTRGAIERGTVVLRDGVIEAVGPDVAVPAGAEVVDCAGLTLYPGMIDGGTRLGLVEIGSAEETVDLDEVGEVTPQMEALSAVNPSSVLIPVTRVAGVTTVLTAPTGGLLPGTAALVRLHGYTPDQMYAGFRGVVLRFPATVRPRPDDERGNAERQKAYDEAVERLDTVWEAAALARAVTGEVALLVEVNAAADILKALDWLAARPRTRAVLTGVAEGWRVADRIAAAGLPAVVGPVIALPTRGGDRYSRPYENAALLHAAGVQVALRTQETENARNLPFHAGFAAAYGAEHGFDRQAALEAVTIAPARIFGVADRLGSIEVGREATLFAADGDPFEPRTQVRHLFIGGYRVPLATRQTALYEEFLERSPGLDR